MTAEQKRAYIEGNGARCPYCKSMSITAGQSNIDGATLWIPVECERCGHDWCDIYILTDVEDHNPEKADPDTLNVQELKTDLEAVGLKVVVL